MVAAFKAPANSSTGLTLNINGKGAKSVLNADGTPVVAGGIAANAIVVAVYDGAAFRLHSAWTADSGVVNAYKVTPAIQPQAVTDLQAGYTVTFRAKSANSNKSTLQLVATDTAAPTVTGLTKDLKRANGDNLAANDIKANQLVTAVYTITDPANGTGEFRLANSTALAANLFQSSQMAPVSLAGGVTGASSVALEGVRTTRITGDHILGAPQQAVLLAGTAQAVAARGAAFLAVADPAARLGLVFRPGEELRATGDITVGNDWGLSKARYAGQPGSLALRAGGNLNIHGTLSDGFLPVSSTPVRPETNRDAKLSDSGDAWSYRLAAGIDTTVAAANPLAVLSAPAVGDTATKGNLVVGQRKLIRTGAGSIDMAARREIKLLDRAAIYTAGRADTSHPSGFTPIPFANATNSISSMFPIGGGDVSLAAGERILMVKTGEATPDLRHINEWLFRAVETSDKNLQWWPRIASFQQGVAAFGGGDIRIEAGSDIKNLTVAIPTSGRVPTVDGERQPDLAEIQGGGDLTLRAGGAVIGGQFYAETGHLNLTAGTLQSNVGIALGNAEARIVARGDASLGNVFNPLWTDGARVYNDGTTGAVKPFSGSDDIYRMRFGSYGDLSSVDLVSLTGNVALNGNDTFYGISDTQTHRLAPARVKVAALAGSIAGNVAQAPRGDGQLDLLAAGSIDLDKDGVLQLDVPASALPSLRNPAPYGNFHLIDLPAALRHSATPWHQDDPEPSRLIALAGAITGVQNTTDVSSFNEAVRIEAGGDISNLNLAVQHTRPDDVSRIHAGGDIVFDTKVFSQGIKVQGAGRLELTAAGSIDLGSSGGIVSRGNLDNFYLSEGGADLFLLAGATPDYAGFRTFLGVGADVGDDVLRGRFYDLLRDQGRAAESGGGEASYEEGRTAIRALFPQANVKGGDINLFASQIKTEQGGNVDLLAPGGSVVVGVAEPTIKKKPAEQGLFTLRDGNIRAYVKNNFLVNQSRVFTLDGGNIMVWADQGSIDAGSGAKTVSATPPPVLVIRNGQMVLDTSNSVSGSGIGVLASRDDTPASDMDLFAPQGAIDAGDAGLRSTGNITLGARTILNASNIQAGGAVAGAPAPVAAPASAPAAAPASPTANDKGDAAAAAAAVGNREGRQGILTVEVLGGEDDPEAKKKKKDDDS
jgi:hypothetical protein